VATLDDFVTKALTQQGKKYHFGVEVDLNDPDPPAFDCAELPEWAAFQCGVPFTNANFAEAQRNRCRDAGTLITLKEGKRTRGALLFRIDEGEGIDHVGISLGNGKTMEARDTASGVGVFSAADIPWTHAGIIPGFEEDDMPDEQTFKKWVRQALDAERKDAWAEGVIEGQKTLGGTLAAIADRQNRLADEIKKLRQALPQ
jgi:NlpC/P60 family